MKVLIVEDERSISVIIKRALLEAGFNVTVVSDGDRAISEAAHGNFDVVILDVMLPGRDGFEVCAELRRQQIESMILMVTARGEISDRVHGLDVGADDYLVKPFEMPELIARIRALGRRLVQHKGNTIRIGPLEIDSKGRTVKYEGNLLTLKPLEFQLLEYMARHEGRTVDRDTVYTSVWVNEEVYSNSLDVHIYELRKKLKKAGAPNMIQTIHRVGYVLRGP